MSAAMQNVIATKRDLRGKSNARRLRQGGQVPAVAYGKDLGSAAITVSPKDVLSVLKSDHGQNSVIKMTVSGGNDMLVMIKEFTFHPVSRSLEHVDFVEVKLDRPVDVEIPVIPTGKAVGLAEGGILRVVYRTLPIRALPDRIPLKIEVDISALHLGDAIHTKDLNLPQGVEARLDVPIFRDFNGYVSVSRAKILLTAPLTGGLFLEEVPPAGEQFYADHDQRWQSQFGVSYSHPSRRVYASVSGRYDSGIPFELPENFSPATFEDPLALTLVNVEQGRAKGRSLLDAMVGSQLYRRGKTTVEAQAGLTNVFNTTYLLNFLSIFNGTHYGAPRTWSARLRVGF